jgi:chromosome segregation ATPase
MEGDDGMNQDDQGQVNPETFDDEDEDEDEVDVAAVIRDFGGHDLMQGIQKTLFDQLGRQLDRALQEKREVENELSKVAKRKEEVGVELYGSQQQLARMQMALENLHNQFHGIAEARVAEEGVLEECKQRHAALKVAHAARQKALLKAQAELDALTATTSQVEKYNEEMKSEIAITRRATYKAESSVVELEKAKQGQDLYIDDLNAKVKGLRENAELYRAQLEEQKGQTDEAKEILKETEGEMDLIMFEKKQLMVQWKASLANLTKRDEAVAAATAQVEAAKVEISDMKAEILGTKRAIVAASQVNEAAIALRDKLTKEMTSMEEQIARIMAERDVLAERYTMLQRSMAQTEDEEKNANSIRDELKKKLDTVQDNITVVARERQAVEAAIMDVANEKTTVSKAVKNYAKAMKAIKEKVHEREMELANVDNELSRVKVDSLNTDAHNVQLRKLVAAAVAELADKDKLIEKYQLEIRQRHDEIEKKMGKVEGLNRKYEKLLEAHQKAGGGEGPLLGPLEATIKALKKEIADLADEAVQLQREWLRDQTALVDTTAETEDILERNNEARAKVTVLGEKKLRAAKKVATAEAEIKRLTATDTSLQTDMARLNELLGKNGKMAEELIEANKQLELEFVSELKELEEKSLAAENKLAGVVDKKDELLDEIMEAERQLLLWEKKIQLEKETQAALDPSVGQGEVHAMEKEIHRMELRQSTLKGERERLVKEIERAVHKRESLSLRFKGAEQANKGSAAATKKKGPLATSMTSSSSSGFGGAGAAGAEMTRASLGKQLAALKASVKQTASASAEYSAAIEERQGNLLQMTAELEAQTAAYGDLEVEAGNLQAGINAQLYEKQRTSELAAKRHKALRRLQALEKGQRQPVTESDTVMIETKLSEAERAVTSVRGVVSDLSERFEHLGEVLGRVMELAADE